MRITVALWALLFSFALVIAVTTAQLSRAADEATRIELDQKSGVIRFVIDGQEHAVLDAAGLYVKGDITYVGMIKDVGAAAGSTAGREGADAR